ncbi:MAG: hypothetical protein QXJ97_08685 [Desulfurococcaceae archaeon]
MEYEVEERSSIDDRRYDLNSFAEKFAVRSLWIPFGLGSLPELRKLFNENELKLEFLAPVKSKLFVCNSFGRNIIAYDRKSFEVTGIYINFEHLSSALMAKSHSGERTCIRFYYFSDLLGFLFYSGAYEKIRMGEYRGSTELAEIILDVGELVYSDPNTLQLLPIEREGRFNTIEYVVWVELEGISGYAGIAIEPPGKPYSLLIYSDSISRLFEIGISRSIRGFGTLPNLSLSTANNLPLVKSIIDSFNDIRNELEKYINNLRLAYVAMKTYKMLVGD